MVSSTFSKILIQKIFKDQSFYFQETKFAQQLHMVG